MEELKIETLVQINGGEDGWYYVAYAAGYAYESTTDYLSELGYALGTVNWFGVS